MIPRSRAAGFSDAEGVKKKDNLLILFFGRPLDVVSERSSQVDRKCYREEPIFSRIHRGTGEAQNHLRIGLQWHKSLGPSP